MKNSRFVLFSAILFLISCAHQDMLGYLKPPDALTKFWQSEGQPESYIEFLSDSEYHVLSDQNNIPNEYAYFKVFHITEKGEVYALVKKIYDDNHTRAPLKSTEDVLAAIENSGDTRYSYEIFYLIKEPEFSSSGEVFKRMRVYYGVCESHLYQAHITLSETDFNLPASVHWDRLRPDGDCGYSIFQSEPENEVRIYSHKIDISAHP